MTHPVFYHDQVLQYIKSDAFTTIVDGGISFELLAKEFELYWRAIIAQELGVNLAAIQHEESFTLPEPFKRKLFLTVWSNNDHRPE